MKTALIIDGNYLLNKDVFILTSMKTLHADLQNLMKIDMDRLMKLYPFDEVFFVSDSSKGYWRKKEFDTYKGTRKRDSTIDWKWVYNEYDEFKEYLKEKDNVNQCQVDLAEGDDLIAHIMNNNNKLGYSNILVASDSDLHQLLRFDVSEKYINIAYNYKFSDEKIYVPENYNVFFHETKRKAASTLFDMNQDDEYLMFIEALINKTKTIEVQTEELLFVKLIQGDRKDAVPSVYSTLTKTGKVRGIGKAGALAAYKLYKELYTEPINFNSPKFVDNILEVIKFIKKIDDADVLKTIVDNVNRNKMLLILEEQYLPKYLSGSINELIKIEHKNTTKKIIEKEKENFDFDDFFD